MNFEKFLEELALLFSVKREELNSDFPLDPKAHWDSLTIISTMALMDDHFQIEISGKQMRSCSTIGDLLKFIENNKTS